MKKVADAPNRRLTVVGGSQGGISKPSLGVHLARSERLPANFQIVRPNRRARQDFHWCRF